MKRRFEMRILRRAVAALTGFILAAALTACGSGKAEKATEKQTEKMQDVSIVLDWYPNAVHAFLYEAIEKGYFAEEGLNVHVQFPSNENDAISLVSAGKAEFGLYYQQDIIQMVADQGVKVKSLGAVCQSPLNIVLSLKDKNILSPKDLEGKIVGYAGTPLSEAMIRVLMRAVGADTNSLTLKNVGFDLMSSMTTGQVDATIGCLVNHEVPQLEEEGFSLNYFSPTDYGVPNYYELCLITNDSVLKDKPELAEKFVRAAKKGFADFKADPDAAVKLLLDQQNAENFPLSESVEKKSAAVLLPKMESDHAPFLSQTESCWQEKGGEEREVNPHAPASPFRQRTVTVRQPLGFVSDVETRDARGPLCLRPAPRVPPVVEGLADMVRPLRRRHVQRQEGDLPDRDLIGHLVGAHQREPRALRLHPHHRQPLVEGGQKEHVHRLVEVRDVLAVPQEQNAVTQAALGHHGLDARP